MTTLPLGFSPSGAVFSYDGRYRYRLHRRWAFAGPTARFVMLNPSTADATVDDPTIRRCIGFARAWGCAGLTVVNLYALRATNPRDLWTVGTAEAVGPENDDYIAAVALSAARQDTPVVAAWGVNAKPDRVEQVLHLLRPAKVAVLGLAKGGHPRHPLYVPASAPLTPWGAS